MYLELALKWFKHMTRMSHDVKIRRVISRYGIEGYGIYSAVLESIAEGLDIKSPEPDLEETAHDIAEYFKMDTVKVEEIMWFCIEQGLFTQDEVTGRIVCHKMYDFLDDTTKKSAQIQAMIERYRSKSEKLRVTPSNSEKLRLEENKSKSKNKSESNAHHPITNKPMNQTTYDTLVADFGQGVVDDYFQRVADYCDAKGKRYKDHAAAVRNWLKRDGVAMRRKTREEDLPPDPRTLKGYTGGNG